MKPQESSKKQEARKEARTKKKTKSRKSKASRSERSKKQASNAIPDAIAGVETVAAGAEAGALTLAAAPIREDRGESICKMLKPRSTGGRAESGTEEEAEEDCLLSFFSFSFSFASSEDFSFSRS